jgi:hypothetical protein
LFFDLFETGQNSPNARRAAPQNRNTRNSPSAQGRQQNSAVGYSYDINPYLDAPYPESDKTKDEPGFLQSETAGVDTRADAEPIPPKATEHDGLEVPSYNPLMD